MMERQKGEKGGEKKRKGRKDDGYEGEIRGVAIDATRLEMKRN